MTIWMTIPTTTASAACRKCSYLNSSGLYKARSAVNESCQSSGTAAEGPSTHTPYDSELEAADDSIGLEIGHGVVVGNGNNNQASMDPFWRHVTCTK